MATFTDLPVDVVREIASFLDPLSNECLRRTNSYYDSRLPKKIAHFECLLLAGKKGDLEMIDSLSHLCNPDELNKVCHYASINGHLKCCDLLIQRGANSCAAFESAAMGGHLELCRRLIEKCVSALSWPLKHAATHGHLEICEMLVKSTAAVDTKALEAALQAAAWNGHLCVCQFLCAKGAANFRVALWCAAEAGRLNVCKWLIDNTRLRGPDIKGAREGALKASTLGYAPSGLAEVIEYLNSLQ